jgi:hypothetical protein
VKECEGRKEGRKEGRTTTIITTAIDASKIVVMRSEWNETTPLRSLPEGEGKERLCTKERSKGKTL